MTEKEKLMERLIYEAVCVSLHYRVKNDKDEGAPISSNVKSYINEHYKGKIIQNTKYEVTEAEILDISSKSKMLQVSLCGIAILLKKPVYFKFRDNFEFINDILLNNRLHAAKYTDLNDPYEGRFKLSMETKQILPETPLLKRTTFKIIDIPKNAKICAFSKSLNNILLWTHYANSCTGVAIGFEINKSKSTEIQEVEYRKLFNMNEIKQPLFIKDLVWEYEKEVRVISKRAYIPIKVKIVILGQRMKHNERKNMKKLISIINKNIIVVDDYFCKMSPSNDIIY